VSTHAKSADCKVRQFGLGEAKIIGRGSEYGRARSRGGSGSKMTGGLGLRVAWACLRLATACHPGFSLPSSAGSGLPAAGRGRPAVEVSRGS